MKDRTKDRLAMYTILLIIAAMFFMVSLEVRDIFHKSNIRKDNADICRAQGFDGYREIDRICGCTATIENNETGERSIILMEYNDLLNTEELCCSESCAI